MSDIADSKDLFNARLAIGIDLAISMWVKIYLSAQKFGIRLHSEPQQNGIG